MTQNQSKGQILIASPDRKVYEHLTRILQEAGYETVPAHTLAEGLKVVHQLPFELFILDWLFEDGTGGELCQAIRETEQETPIFFYTGATPAADLTAALKAGAQGRSEERRVGKECRS